MNRRNVLIGGSALVAVAAGATYTTSEQMGSATDYDAAIAATRVTLSERPEVRELIR